MCVLVRLSVGLVCVHARPLLVSPVHAAKLFNIPSLHYGWNRDPRPKDWHEAGGGKAHNQVMEMFITFVKTCFSMSSFAPDHNLLIRDELASEQMTAHASNKPANHDDPTAVEHDIEKEQAADDIHEPSTEQTKAKKKKSKKGTKHSKEMKGDEDNSPPARCTKTKPTDANETPQMEGNLSDSARVTNMVSSLSAAPNPPPIEHPAFLKNIDPALQQHLAYFAKPVHATGGLNNCGGWMEDSNDFPQCRGQEGEGEEQRGGPAEKNIDDGEDLGGDMTNSPPFPLMAADLPLLDRSIWPPWFKDLAEYLKRYDLGDWWKDTLRCWMVWEGQVGFNDNKGKGAKYGLQLMGRPPAVAEWIKNYHRINPTIPAEDICEFADSCWNWWKVIQPKW